MEAGWARFEQHELFYQPHDEVLIPRSFSVPLWKVFEKLCKVYILKSPTHRVQQTPRSAGIAGFWLPLLDRTRASNIQCCWLQSFALLSYARKAMYWKQQRSSTLHISYLPPTLRTHTCTAIVSTQILSLDPHSSLLPSLFRLLGPAGI